MSTQRDNQFKIRLSDDEVAWIEAIAVANGLTKTDTMRMLIRREFQKLQKQKA